MEVPRLGVELELQLPACTTTTAMPDLTRVCDLYHSSWQCWILNPLMSRARDRTHPHGYQLGSLPAEPQGEVLKLMLPPLPTLLFLYSFQLVQSLDGETKSVY